MPSISNYKGIIPAISCPFTPDHKIDEPALRKLASWLAGHDGVVAIMTNGHTVEVFSLTPSERAEVTRIVADELKGRLPVISSIVCEGLAEAAQHARAAKEAGAVALDVMPPITGCGLALPLNTLCSISKPFTKLHPTLIWCAMYTPHGHVPPTLRSCSHNWPSCPTCKPSRSASAT